MGLRPAGQVVLLVALGEDQWKHLIIMPYVLGDFCREVATLSWIGSGNLLPLHVIRTSTYVQVVFSLRAASRIAFFLSTSVSVD